MAHRPPTTPLRHLLRCTLLLALLALAACRPDNTVAPEEPVAAVKGLALALRENDLARYDRLSLPPALYADLQAQLAAHPTPLPAAELDKYQAWMDRLRAPDAEAELFAAYERRIRQVEPELPVQWPMMKATLGIFLKTVVEANDQLTASEKEHASQLLEALLEHSRAELLIDRARARELIAVMVATARTLQVGSVRELQTLPPEQAYASASQILAGSKRMAAIYGLDLDAALDAVQVSLVSSSGDEAIARVQYPLAGQAVAFDFPLLRVEGRWYPADSVRDAQLQLSDAAAVAAGAR